MFDHKAGNPRHVARKYKIAASYILIKYINTSHLSNFIKKKQKLPKQNEWAEANIR